MQNQNNLSCSLHSKPIEGYCKECQAYICSTCLFGNGNVHKSHTLISLEKLADYLREIIDKNANLIHHEYCDSRSLEVRQAKKAIETQTAQLIERINKDTNKIISIIQKRRDELINQLNTNLQAELEKISEKEAIWNQKTKIAQAINKLQIDYNDELVYNNMIFILKGIEMLKEPLKIYEYKSITDYKDNIAINSTPVTMEDFINVISDMFIIGEDDAIEVPYQA